MTYKETLEKLSNSVITAMTDEVIADIKPNPKISPQKQLEIYIDGYRIRLAKAVEADYPAFCNYSQYANSLINSFVEEQNSSSYSLDFYPLKFVNFLSIKHVPAEVDQLAHLEYYILKAFKADHSEPLNPSIFSSMTESEIDDFRFNPRNSLQTVEFEYDVEKYLQQFRAGENPENIEKRKNFMFIVRHNNEVKRHEVSQDEYQFFQHLIMGSSIDEAVDIILQDNPNFEKIVEEKFPDWIQSWLSKGLFRDI